MDRKNNLQPATILCSVLLMSSLFGSMTGAKALSVAEMTVGTDSIYLVGSPDNTVARVPGWFLFAGLVVLALLVAVIAILAAQRHKYKKAAERAGRTTCFGNKADFVEQFDKCIPDLCRSISCVVFIGFDIVRVNQYYGEDAADEQLVFAENELMRSKADNEIAARVSGGGFAVARLGSSEQEACTWTQELLTRLNRYCEKYGKDYRPDFHAGIYMLQPTDRDCEKVLLNARRGYQLAIDSNVNYAIPQLEWLIHEDEKLQLKKQIQKAIQNREFKMFLQFIVSPDGKIQGAEALSRWAHPQKGLLCPRSYIDLMKSEKTIKDLDFYIFEEVCRQLELWKQEGKDFSISCNFTRSTIGLENFSSRLQTIAKQYFFDYSHLIIEITEDTMEKNRTLSFENISKCQELGFQIALDDMGCGYTSFSDLRDYPINIVKIDRSILTSAVEKSGVALLQGMIALVHSLEKEVLCEGVETAEQVELLRRLGCDYLQGFYFCRPLPKDEATEFLSKHGDRVCR